MQSNDIVMHSVKDIQRMFNFSLTQTYSLVKANGFPSIRIGGRILVEKHALESWLKKNQGKKVELG